MATVLHPWQILVTAMAGWIIRQQDAVIEYLQEENRVLKEQLGRRPCCPITRPNLNPGNSNLGNAALLPPRHCVDPILRHESTRNDGRPNKCTARESVYRRYAIVSEADLSEGLKKLSSLLKTNLSEPRKVIYFGSSSA